MAIYVYLAALTPALSQRARELDLAPFSRRRRVGDEGSGIVCFIKFLFLI